MRTAERGINELQQYVDTLIIIPNQNLFRVANEKTTFADAFKMADDVLYSGVRSVTDLMMKPGLINLDFADVRAVMGGMMGKAMMGTGEAQGEGRAIESAEAAISSPLLDDVSMRGAKAVLINITGGLDMTLYEVDEAANRIREEVDPDAHIIFGSTFDESLQGRIRVSCVATGIDSHTATNLNKSRISDLEKEMQTVALRVEQELSSESHFGTGDSESFTTEMEHSENVIKFTEFESSSPYSEEKLEEDPYAYSTRPAKEEERPLGFFERLMGRKTQPARSPQSHQRPRPQPMISSEVEGNLESEDESIEIPAFLRRQQNR
jgi:cell division protein FtsZ